MKTYEVLTYKTEYRIPEEYEKILADETLRKLVDEAVYREFGGSDPRTIPPLPTDIVVKAEPVYPELEVLLLKGQDAT